MQQRRGQARVRSAAMHRMNSIGCQTIHRVLAHADVTRSSGVIDVRHKRRDRDDRARQVSRNPDAPKRDEVLRNSDFRRWEFGREHERRRRAHAPAVDAHGRRAHCERLRVRSR